MAFSLIASAKGEGSPTGGTTGSIDTTGANIIVVAVGMFGNNSGGVVVSDSKSNIWTALTKSGNTSSNGATRFYYCVSPTVGSGHTFTVSGANTYSSIAAAAFSGVNTSDAFETENSATGASATSGQPGSITPANNGALIVFAGMAGGDGTYVSSVNTGTLLQATTGTSGQDYPTSVSWYEQPTAGAINPTLTTNSASEWAAAIAAFNGVGGAQTVAVNQASTTDTAQAISKAKTKALGQATETDTVQALTARKLREVGQVVETNTAQNITPSGPKLIAVGQASETDFAQAVAKAKQKAIGFITTADQIFSITPAKRKAVGLVTGAEELLPLTAVGGATLALTQEDINAVAAAVWAHSTAVEAHAKLDAILARLQC